MHPTYYNLSADPFRLSPDPRFCFPHRTYRKAMTYMQHALLRAEGFIIITGQPGMGKTTLINDLFRGLDTGKIRVARLVSTQLLADDLLRLVAYELDLDADEMDKASILNRIGMFLRQQHRDGRRTLLIVDEAQDVSGEALEELRLLTNIQHEGHQLLQIFLVGQEQLRDVVSAPELEQLHQRVIAAAHITPLDATETREYIKHRLRRVGWEGDPLISDQTFAMIHHFSRGIPRQINQICSRLLLHGSIEERHRLGLEDLKTVIDELHGEMLLPLGMQEIADSVVWPSEALEETYDERPRTRTENVATDATVATESPARPDRAEPAMEARGSGIATAGEAAAQPAYDDGLNITRVEIDQHDRPPIAADSLPDDRQARRRSRLPAVALSILLVAGLLAASPVVLETETGSRVRDSLLSMLRGIHPDLASALTSLGSKATKVSNPEAVKTAEADHDTLAAPVALQADEASTGTRPEGSTTTTDLPEQASETSPPSLPADHALTANKPVVTTLPPAPIDIQAELSASGLQVERLEDGRLKVNLNNNMVNHP